MSCNRPVLGAHKDCAAESVRLYERFEKDQLTGVLRSICFMSDYLFAYRSRDTSKGGAMRGRVPGGAETSGKLIASCKS